MNVQVAAKNYLVIIFSKTFKLN